MRFFYLLTILFISCGPLDGEDGKNGVNCYDDIGDVNGDGEINSYDCQGAKGEQGDQGVSGKMGQTGPQGPQGEKGLSGEPGQDGSDGKDYIPPESLEGYYILPNGGYIEILENYDGEYIIYGSHRLYSVNYDTGLALHPNLPQGPHNPKDGIISGEYNPNYSSTTNDLEKDGTGSNISGNRKTVYKIILTPSNRLKIQLITFSSNGLEIEANRIIRSN